MGILSNWGRSEKQWTTSQSQCEFNNSASFTNRGRGEEGATAAATTSSFDSLNFNNQNNFTIAEPGGAFQFTQTYSGPGMTNQTIIQRVTTLKSVTDTTSTFTQ